MIGIGTWEAEIKTIFFNGVGRATISDLNGNYDFKLEIIGMNIPKVNIFNVVENGNTLTAEAQCDMFKDKPISITATFNGDTVTGFAKIPMAGRVKFNGRKTA